MRKNTSKPTFLIQILDDQNMTWQGTITFLNTNQKMPFRSVLELLKLMDSAVSPAGFADSPESAKASGE